jgi:hypothetical protein
MAGFEEAFVRYALQNGPWTAICALLVWLWTRERTASARREAALAAAIQEKEARIEAAAEKYRAEALALQGKAFDVVRSIGETVADLKAVMGRLETIMVHCLHRTTGDAPPR